MDRNGTKGKTKILDTITRWVGSHWAVPAHGGSCDLWQGERNKTKLAILLENYIVKYVC